jgi:hypothetical protein
VKVTADTITDEQIRELDRLGLLHPMRRRMALAGSRIARERCADILNDEATDWRRPNSRNK